MTNDNRLTKMVSRFFYARLLLRGVWLIGMDLAATLEGVFADGDGGGEERCTQIGTFHEGLRPDGTQGVIPLHFA